MNILSTRYLYHALLLIVLSGLTSSLYAQKRLDPTPRTPQELKAEGRRWAGKSTISFLENKGQIIDTKGDPRPDILYTAGGGGVNLFFMHDRVSYVFTRITGDMAAWIANDQMESEGDEHGHGAVKRPIVDRYRMDMELIGANPNPRVVASEQIEGVNNYYLGHCPDGITGVRSFGGLRYHEVYPGIDMVIKSTDKGTKCEFIVRPGGRVSDIRMRYIASDGATITSDGGLKVVNPFGYLQEDAPYSYQGYNGPYAVAPVASRYRIQNGVVGFEVPSYDKSQVLVIDPTQQWATFFGGSQQENLNGGDPTEVDRNGNVLVAGYTLSTAATFPFSPGAQQQVNNGPFGFGSQGDAFVVKFNGSGNRLWATFYGGSDNELAHGVATDPLGNVFITGHTESQRSPDDAIKFPVSGSAYQPDNGYYKNDNANTRHDRDAFVVKFDPNGQRLWATYYGGRQWDDGYAFAVDSTMNVAVLMTTGSENLGTPDGFIPTKPTGVGNNEVNYDLLLVKFDVNGNRVWGSYYGGRDNEFGYAAASDVNDNIIITGWTKTTPAMNPVFRVFGANGPPDQAAFGGGSTDAFVVKFDRNGFAKWSTYFGGIGTENDATGSVGYSGMATDGAGNIFIAGFSTQAVPAKNAAVGYAGGGSDAFVVKYDPDGVRQWSTNFGGTLADVAVGAASNQAGGVLITGFTNSQNINTAIPGGQATFQAIYGGGANDAFIAKYDKNGVIKWTTYFGGIGNDLGQGISYDPFGSIVIGGHTNTGAGAPFSKATPNPSPGQVNNPWQANNAGNDDAFISLFCDPDPPKIDSSGPTTFCNSDSVKLSVIPGYTTVQWYEVRQPGNILTTNDTLVINQTGKYYVRVVNASGCVAYSDTINAVRRDRNRPVMTSDSTFCEGDSVRLTVGPDTYARYAWLRGADTVGKTGELWVSQPGLYSLYVVDRYGCRDSLRVTTIQHPKPAPLIVSSNPPAVRDTVVTCEGTPVQLNAAGGSPGVITWMPRNIQQNSVSASRPSESGLYYAISKTAAGCSIVSDSIFVKVIPSPRPKILFTLPTTFCEGDSTVLTADQAYAQYNWSTGETTRSIVVKETSTITLTVTDQYGCTGQAQISVQKVLRPKPKLTALGDTIFCEGGSVTLSATSGYLGYQWSTGAQGQALAVTASGKYWVEANNGPGCTGISDTITVTVRPKPVIALTGPSEVCVNSTATYSVDSVDGYVYQWTVSGAGGSLLTANGSRSIQVKWGPGGTGTISVTVTDTLTRCTATQMLSVEVGSDLVPTIARSRSPILCPGDTIVLDAGDGYSTYKWSTGETTQKIAVTQPGSYSVSVADVGGCSGTSAPVVVTINQAPAPKITASTLSLCPGDSAVLDAGDGYAQYRWADGRSIQKIIVRGAGTFQVTVTDTNGCVGTTEAVTVVMNTPPTPVIDGPNSVCINSTETYQTTDAGSTTFNWKVTGGTIISGQGTNKIVVQWPAAGNGIVELDEQITTTGCKGSATPYPVSIGTTIVPSLISDKALTICDGDSITLSAPSGYATYAWYSTGWSDSVRGGASITVNKPGLYSVYVTTSGGCSGSNVIDVTQKAPIVPTISPNGLIAICEGDSTRLTAASGFASYVWSTGATTQSIMVRTSGDYSVMVFDEDSCSGASEIVKVIVHPNPPTPVITANGDSLTAPAASFYEWSLNGTVIAGATARTLYARASGAYTVRITDSNGCIAVSGPVTTLAATSATVKLPDNVAEPGEKIEVPFELVASQNLDRAHVKGFTAKLRFKRSILMPLNLNFGTNYDAATGQTIMNLKGDHPGSQATGQLLFLEFRAMLGHTLNTDMVIEDFQWIDSSGAPVPCDITVINGQFALKNLCLTGSPRLVDVTGHVGMKAVRPNPTSGLTEIEYEIVESGRTRIYVVNPLGATVATVIDEDLQPGRYIATFNAANLPSGSYFCVLQTPTQRVNHTMQVAR